MFLQYRPQRVWDCAESISTTHVASDHRSYDLDARIIVVGFQVPARPLRFEHKGAHEDLSLPNHALTLTANSKPSSTNTKKERYESLYWFRPPMWCNTLLQCGVVDCLSG